MWQAFHSAHLRVVRSSNLVLVVLCCLAADGICIDHLYSHILFLHWEIRSSVAMGVGVLDRQPTKGSTRSR
jgi:uncharacterized protein (UPF0548 family)